MDPGDDRKRIAAMLEEVVGGQLVDVRSRARIVTFLAGGREDLTLTSA